MQVETGNTPSFFLNWWFCTSNCEPPQLASCPVDLSKSNENKAHETHADCDRPPLPDNAHTADAGFQAPPTRDQHQHKKQEEKADRRKQHWELNDNEREANADMVHEHEAAPGTVPEDYHMFYSELSQSFMLQDCAWAAGTCRLNTIPSSTALDNIPQYKQWTGALWVKDKDTALRNATVTDTVVPVGRKVVHINCVSHAHMHVEKSAAGCLEERGALRFCLKWLKQIDEGNKVRVLGSYVLVCSAQPTHDHCLLAGPSCLALLCTAHA